MKMTILTLALLATSAHARFTGFDNTTAFEKTALGFEVTELKLIKNEGYNHAMDVKAILGKVDGDFKLHINGILLFPIAGDNSRTQYKLKIGSNGLKLNQENSLNLYDALAVDYTPKKIKEGVEIGNSVAKCSSPSNCSLMDEVGDFNLFNGSRASGNGEIFRTYIYGSSQYQSFSVVSLRDDVKKQILEMGPDTIKYFQVSDSSATNSKTYEEHKAEAKAEVSEEFGKSELERKTVRALLKNFSVNFEEKVKRSSRSGCTYFCGRSGRFVRAKASASLNF